ncbi:hypothetical protein BGZ63DRAFT_166122 [Mariannaea sp. PMI_226]|nr:hypothetical protein BGZ63DRAFT_166122 [Mariannaea sp. PMI_226]
MAPVSKAGPYQTPCDKKGGKASSPGETKTRKKPCNICGAMVGLKSFADHVKTHYLKGDKHGQPAVRRCKMCERADRECRVARDPRCKLIHTFRCARCLENRERCSFLDVIRHLGKSLPDVHPGLDMGDSLDDCETSAPSRESSQGRDALDAGRRED